MSLDYIFFYLLKIYKNSVVLKKKKHQILKKGKKLEEKRKSKLTLIKNTHNYLNDTYLYDCPYALL